jgi:hypothetical protein
MGKPHIKSEKKLEQALMSIKNLKEKNKDLESKINMFNTKYAILEKNMKEQFKKVQISEDEQYLEMDYSRRMILKTMSMMDLFIVEGIATGRIKVLDNGDFFNEAIHEIVDGRPKPKEEFAKIIEDATAKMVAAEKRYQEERMKEIQENIKKEVEKIKPELEKLKGDNVDDEVELTIGDLRKDPLEAKDRFGNKYVKINNIWVLKENNLIVICSKEGCGYEKYINPNSEDIDDWSCYYCASRMDKKEKTEDVVKANLQKEEK